ncbi:RHS repeat-associated core domain-containing protein, partial [Pseudomonas sp. MF7453]|uniref:RHS repeat-associated core domain-containing protein n=1 Tax=Pseudomonas sp. MF7453 TaxID=2797539 RepID=UPI0018E82BC8
RLIRKRTDDGITEYAYDNADNLLAINFTDIRGDQQRLDYSYDALGQLLSETNSAGLLQYDYDELGNLQTLTLPDQRQLNHLYYGSGHLHQINLGGRVISDFERDALHDEVLRTQGSLLTRTRYDRSGRLSQKALHYQQVAREVLPLLQKDYQYDASDNLVAEILTQTQRPGANRPTPAANDDSLIGRFHNQSSTGRSYQGSAQYGYNPVEQIQSVHRSSPGLLGQHIESLNYDPAGNLFDGYRVNGLIKHNRVHVYQDKRYRYDRFGRLSEKRIGSSRIQHFEYDAEHRLTCIRQQQGSMAQRIVFNYDPLGRRISKRVYNNDASEPNNRTLFHWQGLRLLGEVQDGRPSLYVYADPGSYEPLARVDGKPGSEAIYYFHTNLAGLPEQITDTDGHTVWHSEYLAWGRTRDEWHDRQAGGEQNLRFQGQYLDRETGLHYNTFRFFDPDVGRFTQPDPIGLAGGLNLYQYAPNAIGWVDPLGWAPVEPGDVIDYGKRAPGFEKHHGILDAWSKHNIKGYASRNGQTPTVVMTEDQHTATKDVAKDWIQKKTGKRGFNGFDWKSVSKFEILRLSNKMFAAAEAKGFPKAARILYNKAMKNYLRKVCEI